MPKIERTVKVFFSKLANGDFGLAETYWLYGVVVAGIVNILTKVIKVSNISTSIFIAHTVYIIPVTMGIWNAANKYKGPKIWAVLARVVVFFALIMLGRKLLSIQRLLDPA